MTDTKQNELVHLIKSVLNGRIRPVLQEHGGDVVFKDFDETGVLWVELQGACNGCPGALNTLKGNIEHFMKLVFPEIKEVKDVYLEKLQTSIKK